MSDETYFVFGYFGRKNTGDDAMLLAFVRECRKRRCGLHFRVVAGGELWVPDDLRSCVVAVPKRPLDMVKALIQSDRGVMVGGTSIQDFRSHKRYIRVLAGVLAVAAFCKITHKPFSLVGVGIGPLDTWWGRLLAAGIIRLTSYVSCRDSDSVTLAGELVPSLSVRRSFDLSVMLDKGYQKSVHRRCLGISILPYYEIYQGRPELDIAFAEALSRGIRLWLAGNPEWTTRVFVFKGCSGEDDVEVSSRLAGLIGTEAEVVEFAQNPEDTLREVGSCSIFIGMRLHSCLFSYIQMVPTIMLDYHPKCESIAREIGLPSASLLKLDDVFSGKIVYALEGATVRPRDYLASHPVGLARTSAECDIEMFMSKQ